MQLVSLAIYPGFTRQYLPNTEPFKTVDLNDDLKPDHEPLKTANFNGLPFKPDRLDHQERC